VYFICFGGGTLNGESDIDRMCVVSFYRVRVENLGGAWCPRNQITSDAEEWLQVSESTMVLRLRVFFYLNTPQIQIHMHTHSATDVTCT